MIYYNIVLLIISLHFLKTFISKMVCVKEIMVIKPLVIRIIQYLDIRYKGEALDEMALSFINPLVIAICHRSLNQQESYLMLMTPFRNTA